MARHHGAVEGHEEAAVEVVVEEAAPIAAPMSEQERGGRKRWEAMLAVDESAENIGGRYARLLQYFLAPYGRYKIPMHVPSAGTLLQGNEQIAYILDQVAPVSKGGEPKNYFEAIERAHTPKNHNGRRNIGEEVFETLANDFVARVQPHEPRKEDEKDGAYTRRVNAHKREVLQTILEAPTDDPDDVAKFDAYVLRIVDAFRESEALTRTPRNADKATNGESESEAPVADEPPKPKVNPLKLL